MSNTDTQAPTSYRLVDADTHVNEPPDLWVSRVPEKFRDRVPRMERFEDGDGWVAEGLAEPINFGFNASATLPREERRPWMRFEDIAPGGHDPKARLAELDADRIDAAVFYPTPRLSHIVIATQEPELHLAMVRAYNDWLIEYTATDPDRLGAIILVPNRGVDMAVAEIERCSQFPSVVGVLIGCYPHGDTDLAEEDDPVWRTATELGFTVHVHVGLTNQMPRDMYAAGRITAGHAEGDLRFVKGAPVVVQFVNSGVFDRLPDLQVAMVEIDAGWVPYVKEQMDNRLRRRLVGPDARFTRMPSEYIEEHFTFTYLTDSYAVRNRHEIGVDRLMWSSDFPHTGSDWPNSWRTIAADFAGVPREERDLIVAGNAMRHYKFGSR